MRRTRAQLAVQVDAPAESYEGEEPIALDSDCLDGPPGERWR